MSVQPLSESLAFGPAIVTGLALSIFAFLCQTIIYQLLLSPLRHIPGPKLGAITPFYLDCRYYVDSAVPFIKSLHREYGPIVRVGPSEVVINDANNLGLIYGSRSTFRKPDTAVLGYNHDYPNTFSAITREEHKQTRRQVAKVYTMSSILKNEALTSWIQNCLCNTLNIIESNKGAPVDIFAISAYFALDVVSYLVYGRSFDLLRGNNLRVAHDIRTSTCASIPVIRFFWLFGHLKVWPLTYFLPNIFRIGASAAASLEAANLEQFGVINSSQTKPDPENTAVGCMQAQPGYGKSLNDGHVMSECLDHIVAGEYTPSKNIPEAQLPRCKPRD